MGQIRSWDTVSCPYCDKVVQRLGLANHKASHTRKGEFKNGEYIGEKKKK